MKLTSLTPRNWLGAPSRPLKIKAPVVCIAGPNGSGKSSLLEAIAFALVGRAPRAVSLKKDYPGLVTEGADGGTVSVAFEDGLALRRDIVTGKVMEGEEPDDALRAQLGPLLDLHDFARMLPEAQRKFIIGLLEIRMPWGDVEEVLREEGVDGDVLEAVHAYMSGGFAAAEEQAKARASEARGAWKAVTGENYGSVKAPSWRAPGFTEGATDEVDTAALETAVTEARTIHTEAVRADADLRALRQQWDTAQAFLKTASSERALQAAITTQDTRITELEELIAKLSRKAEAKGGVTGTCPHCEGQITYSAGTFVKGAAQAASPKDLEALTTAKQDLVNARRTRDAEVQQLERVRTTRESLPMEVTDEQLELSATSVANAAGGVEQATRALNDAGAEAIVARQARERTQQAALHHADVEAWTKAQALLAPDGVQATLLGRKLAPINTTMAEVAREIGWPAPRIDADFTIRVGSRPRALHSVSEQWRIDCILATAIAQHSGLRFLLLDAFDLLEKPARSQLLGWLGTVGKERFDTVIAAGTLAANPTVQLREAFGDAVQVLWLG